MDEAQDLPPLRPGVVERRAEHRAPVNAPARLFYGPGYGRWMDCVIKDRSEHGAKIEAPPSFELPRRLVLLDYRAGVAFLAETRWRKWGMAGLRLDVRFDLRELADPSLEPVRRAWLALGPGLGAGVEPGDTPG